MDAPLSHNSAARLWLAYGTPGVPKVVGSISQEDVGFRAPSKDVVDAVRSLEFLGEPLHFLVSSQKARHARKRVAFHSRYGNLPPDSVLRLEGGLCVCSPKLTFLQMGTVLPTPLLALFGMQLCGIHAIDPWFEEETESESAMHSEGCLSGLPKRSQLTGCERLASYLRDASSLAGSKRAAAALKLVAERSRSPMESATALLLGASKRIGGHALPKPILNQRIDLPRWLYDPDGAQQQLVSGNQPFAEVDLVFQRNGRAVYVDYHGEWSHSGEHRIHHDSLRSNEFAGLGMFHLSITKWQFYDSGLLTKVAGLIRSALGMDGRIRTQGYERKKAGLHRMVTSAVRTGFMDSLGPSGKR